MIKTFGSGMNQRGGLGVLTFFCLLFVLVLLAFLFWPDSELVAKPTVVVENPEVILKEPEPVKIPVISGNITNSPSGAVSLDEPRPKISPELVKELKQLQKERKRAKVLINVKDDKALEALQKTVSDAGGQITQSFAVGDVAVVDLPADKVEEVSEAVGVEEISNEKEYVAFLADRIPAFGVDKVWESNITGKNVKIAVLDTGVGPHSNISVYGGRSFVSGEDTADQNGHGTHVAGIAQGVARGAQIYNAKVLSKTGSGSTSQIIAGINWAVDPNGDNNTDDSVDIISMSFGGMFTDVDGPLASAVKEAIQKGVVFVVASGNCRQGCGGFYGVTTPGNVKEVITVGAVDDGNVVTSFSSGDTFSDYVKPDVVAPGKDITSAWLNNGWRTLSGTSMSTPFVSGVVALMLEKESLTHAQVKQKLESNAIDLGIAGKDSSYGVGLVNVSFLIPVTAVNVTINQTNETNTTIPVNETVPVSNETNEIPANATKPVPVSFDTESRLRLTNVSDFEYLLVNNASEFGVSDQIAIYAKGEGRIYVQEMVFDNVLDFTNMLYGSIPLASESLVFLKSSHNFISYDNRTWWYNDNAIYSAKSADVNNSDLLIFLDEYSEMTGNNVKQDGNDNLKNLEKLDNEVISYISQMNNNGSFEPLYGGSTPSGAYTLSFGQSYWESFWTQGAQNWYYTSTSQRGTLEFGVKDISSGDNLDIYVYNYDVSQLMCRSTRSGSSNDACTVSKSTDNNWGFYLKVIPTVIDGTYARGYVYSKRSCTAGWTSTGMQCRTGNEIYREYQNQDCSITWTKVDDCDNYDDSGSWYCDGNTPKKVSYDYSCTGSGTCSRTSSTDTRTCTSAQKCSSGSCVDKTCSDYSNNGGSCTYASYFVHNTACKNGNPGECEPFGNTYCYQYSDTCTSEEYCDDPLTGGAQCFAYPCTVSSVSWDTNSAVVGSSVGITVQGSHCSNSNYVTFDVFENNCWGAWSYNESQFNETKDNETNLTAQGICNEAVNTNPATAYFSSNTARTTWTAEYMSDISGNPEYYAHAYLNGDTDEDTRSGNFLTVSCRDNDGDGYSNYGGDCGNDDCNDNDANIHPGATERCNNIDDDCDGSRDEGIDLQTDANNCGSCGNACGTGGACHDGQCYSTQCAGYADTIGSCSTKGDYKKESNKVYECKDMILWGTLLCWKKVASKGDSNYCSLMTCSHGEYDCEDGECSGNLVCKGPRDGDLFGPSGYDGCCYSYEEWNTSSYTCKKQDGISCSSGSECNGGYCVHNACWNLPYRVLDGQCDIVAGETCSNSPNDCKKCDGVSCSVASECKGGYCIHNACWNAAYKIGDGYCDQPWETNSNSPNDCFGQLNVLQITTYPSIVDQGQTFTVKARVKNNGTIRDTLKLEAGIYADSWETFTLSEENFSSQSYYGISKCCAGNDYFSAVQITLDPNQEEEVTFSIKAPTIHSFDACNNLGSAWDSSHTLVVGLYRTCGGGYVQYRAKDIKVRDKYCYRDSDCDRSDEYCEFGTGTRGVCAVLTCMDECTNYDRYYCKDSKSIWKCVDDDNDECYEEKYVRGCLGNYVCVDGQSSCVDVSVKAGVKAEESQSFVYKQPGDVVHINLIYDRNENIQLEYDSNAFMLDSQTCPADQFAITQNRDCVFKVYDTAEGDYRIGLRNGNSVKITVIKDPDSIFITNKKKLKERFNDDSSVNSLLSQAYSTAGNQRGIVYDLNEYVLGHPWSSFNAYSEDAKNPLMTNNAYAIKSAAFAKQKCNKCKNVIILGDDFVVPMFRADYADVAKWFEFWQADDELKYIYTNQPYTPTTTKTIIDVDQIFKSQDELKIVMPDLYDLSSEIAELSATLDDYDLNIETINSDDIDCDSKITLGDANLIIIGNRENNNAIKCTPWFDDIPQSGDSFDASITLERNIWGGDSSYALIISGDDPGIGLDGLNKILKAPEYYENSIVAQKNKVYLRELTDPPDDLTLGEIWQGYVIGNCEEISGSFANQGSCMASDMALSVAPITSIITDIRDFVSYCIVKRIKTGSTNDRPGVLENVVCISSSSGAVLGVAALIPEPAEGGAVIADAFAAICKRISKSLLEIFGASKSTIAKLSKLFDANVLGFNKIFNFFDVTLEWGNPAKTVRLMWEGTNRLIKIMSENSYIWKKITRYFSDDQLNLLKNLDDFDNVAQGTKKILGYGSSTGKIEDTGIPKLVDNDAITTCTDIGKLKDVKGIGIPSTSSNAKPLANTLAQGSADSGTIKGAAGEVRRASGLADDVNVKNLEADKNIPVSGTSNGKSFTNMETDMFYEKDGFKWAEEVKNKEQLSLRDFINDNGVNQLDRYSEALRQGKIDKVQIIIDDTTRLIDETSFMRELTNRGFTLKRVTLPKVK